MCLSPRALQTLAKRRVTQASRVASSMTPSMLTLVAQSRGLGLQIPEPAQAQPIQCLGHGCEGSSQQPGDLAERDPPQIERPQKGAATPHPIVVGQSRQRGRTA